MTDRETVIVELRDSIEILSDFDTQEYTFRERQQLHGSVIAAIQDALALLKAQEPRILTADEMKAWDKDVWIEDFDEDRVIALDESVAGFAVACMRGKKRCWTARPTEEQRKAVPWE